MKKILYASAIYPTKFFDTFLRDTLATLTHQTYKTFDILLFLDCVGESTLKPAINHLRSHINGEVFTLGQSTPTLNPTQIRLTLIKEAYKRGYDYVFFGDFDETSDLNRIQATLEQIGDFDFGFTSFYPTDFSLRRLSDIDFHASRHTPATISYPLALLDRNFVGLGTLALSLKKPLPLDGDISHIKAFDWFLGTLMLLHGFQGKRIEGTFLNYRQHTESYVGMDRPLDEHSLKLGLEVKKAHYAHFSSYDGLFEARLEELLKLDIYLSNKKNQVKYIQIVNENFDPKQMCWWENIKTLKELEKWI